jgi:hypothetical protein
MLFIKVVMITLLPYVVKQSHPIKKKLPLIDSAFNMLILRRSLFN